MPSGPVDGRACGPGFRSTRPPVREPRPVRRWRRGRRMPRPWSSVPQLLDTTRSASVPWAWRASMRAVGTPHRPNPPTASEAPSPMSATAWAAVGTVLSMRSSEDLRGGVREVAAVGVEVSVRGGVVGVQGHDGGADAPAEGAVGVVECIDALPAVGQNGEAAAGEAVEQRRPPLVGDLVLRGEVPDVRGPVAVGRAAQYAVAEDGRRGYGQHVCSRRSSGSGTSAPRRASSTGGARRCSRRCPAATCPASRRRTPPGRSACRGRTDAPATPHR